MKANELMIGDWVYSTFAEHPCKVEGIEWVESGYAYVNISGVDGYKCIESLSPIPLTPEILKKNGFRYDDSPFTQGWCGYGLLIYNGRVTAGQNVSMECQYAHRLQHILRLSGVNELADNFKI